MKTNLQTKLALQKIVCVIQSCQKQSHIDAVLFWLKNIEVPKDNLEYLYVLINRREQFINEVWDNSVN